MKVGLCDDEQHIHDTVDVLLQEYEKENHIEIEIFHYTLAEQLLSRKDKLDVLLLDIEMPQIDGIEAGFKLRSCGLDYKIIMLTAREDRFRDAFKIGAFRFLSKPIQRMELYQALREVRETMIGEDAVTVYRDGVACEVLQKDILYIEADASSTLIFTNRHEFRSERSLSEWKELLDERLFFQSHKSFIVNLSKIETIQTGTIQLVSGDKVAVSRRLRTPLFTAYMQYDTKWR
jgi:DNA-binding LytR/AlgR family response regulator